MKAACPPGVRAALLVLLNHTEPGWDNCRDVVKMWLDGKLNTACCEETPCQWGDHPCERKRPYAKDDAARSVSPTTGDVTHTLQLVRQAIFHVLDEPKPKSGLTWDFEDDEDRVDFADAVVEWLPSRLPQSVPE